MNIEEEIQKILIKIRTGKEVTVGDDTIIEALLIAYEKEKEKNKELETLFLEDKIKAKIEEKFLEAKGLYERGVQPQAQYTMKLLRGLEKSLLEKE